MVEGVGVAAPRNFHIDHKQTRNGVKDGKIRRKQKQNTKPGRYTLL